MEMTDRPQNSCTVKRKCMMCKDVDLEDRPMMCESLACEFYIPCSRCGMNANNIDPEIGHCNDPNCKYKNITMESVDIVVGDKTITSFDSTPQ